MTAPSQPGRAAVAPATEPNPEPAVVPLVELAAAEPPVAADAAPASEQQVADPFGTPFHDRTIPAPTFGGGIGFRTRLTFALISAAVIPVAVFGLLLVAAERLGIAAPWCLALEDSHNGVRSASAAGMMTIMVPDLVPPTEEIEGLCDCVVQTLHDIVPLVAGPPGLT